MTRFVAVLLLTFSILLPGAARAHTLSIQVRDKYLLGKGIVAYDGPVVQTDLFLNLPRGFYVDLWWSASLDNTDLNADYGDEIDYTVGWAGKVRDFNLDLGVSYFDLARLYSMKGGDVVQPYLDFGRSFQVSDAHSLTPYVRVETEIPIGWQGDAKGVRTSSRV